MRINYILGNGVVVGGGGGGRAYVEIITDGWIVEFINFHFF